MSSAKIANKAVMRSKQDLVTMNKKIGTELNAQSSNKEGKAAQQNWRKGVKLLDAILVSFCHHCGSDDRQGHS